MRCSYYRNINNNSNNSESERGSQATDIRIYPNINTDSWHMKKVNQQRKNYDKYLNFSLLTNNSNNMKPVLLPPVVEIEDTTTDTQYEEDKNANFSIFNKETNDLSTSDLEIILFKTKINPVDTLESDYSKGTDESYCKIPNKPDSDNLSEFYDNKVNFSNKSEVKESRTTNQSNTFIKTMNESERATTTPNVLKKNLNNHSIKHNLPFSALPCREKYKINKTKPVDVNIIADQNSVPVRQSSITLISHISNVCTQTDPVLIVQDDEQNALNFIRKYHVTLDQLNKRFTAIFSDAETNTDNIKTTNTQEAIQTEEAERLKQAVACSQLNKILLKNHGTFCRNVYPFTPERPDCVIDVNGNKGENLQKIVDRLRPSLEEINNNVHHRPDEQTSTIKRRRVSLPALPQNNLRNENQILNDQVQVAKRPPLRGQRKLQMPSQTMYHHEQYHHHTAMPEGPNYGNANVPDNRMNPQFQFPRPQQPQVATTAEKQLPPYYNTGPRMMHPYAMQYGREHIPQYPGPQPDHWGYQQHYVDRSAMLQQPMSADVVPSHIMPTGQHPPYRHGAPVHVSNYTNTDWLKNSMQNNGNM